MATIITGDNQDAGSSSSSAMDHICFFMPLSLRTSLAGLDDLDNRTSVLTLQLPLHEPNKVRRLRQIGERREEEEAMMMMMIA